MLAQILNMMLAHAHYLPLSFSRTKGDDKPEIVIVRDPTPPKMMERVVADKIDLNGNVFSYHRDEHGKLDIEHNRVLASIRATARFVLFLLLVSPLFYVLRPSRHNPYCH